MKSPHSPKPKSRTAFPGRRLTGRLVPVCFYILLLFGCKIDPKPSTSGDAAASVPQIEPPSTAFEFPTLTPPVGFYLDSLETFDSLDRAQYSSYFYRSRLPEMADFNHAIAQAVQMRVDWERSFVDPYHSDGYSEVVYSYLLRPTAIYVNDKVISITHVADTYGEGGNHHNYAWFTFNFDRVRKRRIGFQDLFPLPTRQDSAEFVARVQRNALRECMDWGLPFDSVDVSIAEGGIFINPELSWACGPNLAFLPADSLSAEATKWW